MAKNWAIVIGINDYSYLDKLNYAKADAEAMHQWLQQEGGFNQIFLFTDNSPSIPTNPPILTKPTFGHLDAFFHVQFERQLLKRNDNLWFFFSGHGNRGSGGDYLMLSDSNPGRLENSALSVSYVAERLRNWGAGNVVMFIDACRNVENPTRGGNVSPHDYPGMISFYSCRDKEKSLELKDIGRGAFTHILLQTLEETKEQNGCLTVGELEGQLMREVPKLSPNQHPLAKVEPTYKSNFILFGEAQEQDIETLKNLAYRKAFQERREEARELLIHANIAAKGADMEVLDALNDLSNLSESGSQSSQSELKSKAEQELVPEPKPKSKTSTSPNGSPLQVFKFKTVTVNTSGQEVKQESGRAKYFRQDLGGGITLDMMNIYGGKFMMGKDREIEKAGHEVTIQPFFMGKYPITQEQWRVIAFRKDLKVERDLETNPAHFKDSEDSNRCPVENVSWYDAQEFCGRLSKLTGEKYRLPSEAEWEYACRAGTLTPFYFGETITTDLANYNGNYTYADEPKGKYREKTTLVGTFPPNGFGLYDMHGNVLEWCADESYDEDQGPPKDGRPWVVPEKKENDNRTQILRGGSWLDDPLFCPSVYRYYAVGRRDFIFFNIGFRVVCVAART